MNQQLPEETVKRIEDDCEKRFPISKLDSIKNIPDLITIKTGYTVGAGEEVLRALPLVEALDGMIKLVQTMSRTMKVNNSLSEERVEEIKSLYHTCLGNAETSLGNYKEQKEINNDQARDNS